MTALPAWLLDAQAKDRRKNQILFTRDSVCLQPLLSLIRQQTHLTMSIWALENCTQPLSLLSQRWPEETRPRQAVALSWQWARGEVKMPMARPAILAAHQAAKQTSDPVCRALCHAVGQACGAVHVETHAIGLAFYELTALVRLYGWSDCVPVLARRLDEYRDSLLSLSSIAPEGPWAPFLLVDRPNKEQRLAQKQ